MTWKEAMEEKGLRVNAGKSEDHDLWYGLGPPAAFRVSFRAQSVALEWEATSSSATAASIGCTRNAVGSSA